MLDFSIDTSGTPQDVQRRQKLADALLEQGMNSTPAAGGKNGGWITALNRGLAGALGGYQSGQISQEDRAGRDQANAQFAAFPGNTPPNSLPSNAPQNAPTAGAAASSIAPDTAGKIYSNDEPSPLDPPSGADRQKMMATILGEAGNEPQLGKNAVASVIRTRAVDGGYGGDTPSGVVQSPNQFEPWNTQDGRARMAAALSNPKQAAAADAAIASAYGEGGKAPEDPTEGMTHFYSPKGQAAMGRPAPAWAGGDSVTIGGHVFNSPDDAAAKPVQVASNDPGAVPSNAAPTQGYAVPGQQVAQAAPDNGVRAWAMGVLQNPRSTPIQQQLAKETLAASMKQETHAQETDKDGNVWDVNKQTGQKTIALKSESDPKWGVVGKDKYGQPVYGYPPTREEAAAQTKNAPIVAQDQPDLTNVHGEDYLGNLKKSDPKMESQVRAIIEGRTAYPTGMLLKTPYGQELASHVTQADPTFEAGNGTARVKVRNEFMSGGVGSPAGQISAGNTALQHAGEMSDALERMKTDGGMLAGIGSSDIPYVSKWANELHNSSVQGTSGGKNLNDFMTAKNHFSEEVTKFYAGSAGSEAERARALANLDAAKSLPELRSAIKTEANLMQGKVNALQERWKNGMGPLVKDFPLISKESQSSVDRVLARDQSSTASSASAPAAVDPSALAEAKRRGLIP
jgi:spore germination cell wall hydrolase CwlJ-like protein